MNSGAKITCLIISCRNSSSKPCS